MTIIILIDHNNTDYNSNKKTIKIKPTHPDDSRFPTITTNKHPRKIHRPQSKVIQPGPSPPHVLARHALTCCQHVESRHEHQLELVHHHQPLSSSRRGRDLGGKLYLWSDLGEKM